MLSDFNKEDGVDALPVQFDESIGRYRTACNSPSARLNASGVEGADNRISKQRKAAAMPETSGRHEARKGGFHRL
jgi:hypothetical protein